MYSVQAFVAAEKRDTLQRRFQEERRQLRATLKSFEIGTRRDRISHQAVAFDEAAIVAPRHIRYREQADRRSKTPRIEIGIVSGREDPRKPILEGINWVADARGVDYRVRNRTLFRDEGRRVVFCVVDDDAVRAGLMLCREKWIHGLRVSGTDEFKAKVKAIAATMHIRVADPATEQPAPGSEADYFRMAAATNTNATSKDLERLFSRLGKPVVAAELRVGRQHTGRIIDAKIGAGEIGIVVMDVGREVAIIRTDSQSAGRMMAVVGQQMTARVAITHAGFERFGWQFVELRGIESNLEHSR
jgi:hypothetical protein